MTYSILTKYLPYFKHAKGGKWTSGAQANGTTQFPYVDYDNELLSFIDDFNDSTLRDQDYMQNMDTHGWWEISAMEKAIATMSAKEIGTCITAICQKERLCEGTLLIFIENKIFEKLLSRLKELED